MSSLGQAELIQGLRSVVDQWIKNPIRSSAEEGSRSIPRSFDAPVLGVRDLLGLQSKPEAGQVAGCRGSQSGSSPATGCARIQREQSNINIHP